MSAHNDTLKILPFSVTKGKLLELYGNQMADSFIIKEINTIIVANRRIDKNVNPKVVKVLHIEFMEFVELYGLPQGYRLPVESKT